MVLSPADFVPILWLKHLLESSRDGFALMCSEGSFAGADFYRQEFTHTTACSSIIVPVFIKHKNHQTISILFARTSSVRSTQGDAYYPSVR